MMIEKYLDKHVVDYLTIVEWFESYDELTDLADDANATDVQAVLEQLSGANPYTKAIEEIHDTEAAKTFLSVLSSRVPLELETRLESQQAAMDITDRIFCVDYAFNMLDEHLTCNLEMTDENGGTYYGQLPDLDERVQMWYEARGLLVADIKQ